MNTIFYRCLGEVQTYGQVRVRFPGCEAFLEWLSPATAFHPKLRFLGSCAGHGPRMSPQLNRLWRIGPRDYRTMDNGLLGQ